MFDFLKEARREALIDAAVAERLPGLAESIELHARAEANDRVDQAITDVLLSPEGDALHEQIVQGLLPFKDEIFAAARERIRQKALDKKIPKTQSLLESYRKEHQDHYAEGKALEYYHTIKEIQEKMPVHDKLPLNLLSSGMEFGINFSGPKPAKAKDCYRVMRCIMIDPDLGLVEVIADNKIVVGRKDKKTSYEMPGQSLIGKHVMFSTTDEFLNIPVARLDRHHRVDIDVPGQKYSSSMQTVRGVWFPVSYSNSDISYIM